MQVQKLNVEEIVVSIIQAQTTTKIETGQEYLIQDLSIDSFGLVQIIVNIEERFNIEIPIEILDVSRWQTVKDAVGIVSDIVKTRT
ncbi:phosphopantetheine-binding protein [Hominifimenecus microfluidus]|uniref:Phosphopantetheine-binding protein n=1 Tax=Hominifimenecus microfluidus TaxID=2885348 RepID=A0AAE3EDG8_9FIRM|nr:phosphopantetheine-binding protein [Hominifimenecus microfluidus]MCC2231830.1 phosphopantetheine-binding protein [Hominifimenecus microfluidus]